MKNLRKGRNKLFLIYKELYLNLNKLKIKDFQASTISTYDFLRFIIRYHIIGAPRGFGDLGRRAIYFQGAGKHC